MLGVCVCQCLSKHVCVICACLLGKVGLEVNEVCVGLGMSLDHPSYSQTNK